MSKELLTFLIQNRIEFAIPLKKDTQIRRIGELKKQRVDKSFNNLPKGQYDYIKAVLWDHKVTIAGYRNEKGELMVVASLYEIDIDIFSLYRHRWSIERLFFHFKTGGFNLEDSHITRALVDL